MTGAPLFAAGKNVPGNVTALSMVLNSIARGSAGNPDGVGVAVGGAGVDVGGIGVAVGIGVFVGGTRVAVGCRVAVGVNGNGGGAAQATKTNAK